jgi:DNA ligase (NAD+)
MTVQETVKKLIEAKEAYYNDDPIMQDSEFDELENELRKLDPSNDYFNIVGIPAKGEKIKHLYPMLSMNKANSIEEVQSWLNKIIDKRVELIVEPKIDGLSCSIVYDKGKLQYISTRGDGEEGRIISHIKDYINIPKIISSIERTEVRGELYLPLNTALPNPDSKPLRSLAVGLINRKDTGLEDLKYINFVGYQVIGSILTTESFKIDYIQTLGFRTVPYKIVMSIQELRDYFEEYKSVLREKWNYQTDGLIICVNDNSLHGEINKKYIVEHHNHYNIALKPPAESRWTTVVGITWQVSRAGRVIPVVNTVPVIIGGSEIKNPTGHNLKNIKTKKLNIGDKVLISKANDVIPKLLESVPTKEKSELIPTHCPSCNTELIEEEVQLICPNTDCPERNIQLITYWVAQNKMDDISEATVRLLYDNKFITSIKDLYHLNDYRQYINALPGFGDKKTENLFNQIEKTKMLDVVQFISRLGIELVGEKAVKKMKIKTMEDFWNFNDVKYVIGQNLILYKKANKNFINQLASALTISNVVDKQSKGKVCMTGSGHASRDELIKEIESMGYEFVDSITKQTDILICEDVLGDSGKLKKAKKLGIKLMNYTEFFK